jgi:uncharacterized protein VirK/YbjX
MSEAKQDLKIVRMKWESKLKLWEAERPEDVEICLAAGLETNISQEGIGRWSLDFRQKQLQAILEVDFIGGTWGE